MIYRSIKDCGEVVVLCGVVLGDGRGCSNRFHRRSWRMPDMMLKVISGFLCVLPENARLHPY